MVETTWNYICLVEALVADFGSLLNDIAYNKRKWRTCEKKNLLISVWQTVLNDQKAIL